MILFASRHTKTLTVDTPEGPVEIVIAAVPRRPYLAAQQTLQTQFMDQVKTIGGVGVMKEISDFGGADRVRQAAKNVDPLLTFDVPTLVRHGVKQINGGPPAPEVLEDLAPAGAEYI